MPPEYSVGKCLLLDLLNSRYMTQADLISKTGIAKSQISAYINNKNIMSLSTARVISRTLKCRIEDLYEWND
ncbi:helix-turn-helix domain-containing protein [Cytobacillus gottheilii]|uniref:helix-turn-helix domain-containing protein n=1 Tax=Cytobacillus gottheilii TaxID=859144 RepID=UPI0009BAAAEF|nr:helix-turn-helix transcriptional regulator [Cytobacillus gottheilii]